MNAILATLAFTIGWVLTAFFAIKAGQDIQSNLLAMLASLVFSATYYVSCVWVGFLLTRRDDPKK